jgi:predicted TIM-barrel fold metal-dependent hydrolase
MVKRAWISGWGRCCASLWLALCLVSAAGAEPARYTMADFARVPKIDTHVHLHGALPRFMAQARRDGFQLLTINVDYADFPPIAQQQRDAVMLAGTHPAQVAWVATFPLAGFESPGWTKTTLQRMAQARALGAQGVKVWKNLGLDLRDRAGTAVLIDDARLQPLFNAMERDGWTLLGHQAEPRNAWLEPAQMTTKADRAYFNAHPQYHMAHHPEWPNHEAQLAARDRFLQQHPRLPYVGMHLASLEWSVERLAAFLDRFPDAVVDLAARMGHLQQQAIAHHEAVRTFVLRYQDRLLYGSDLAVSAGQRDAEFAAEAEATWRADWRFLVTNDRLTSADLDAPFRGLALPAAVVDKLYHHNARRVFPQAWRYDEAKTESTR